MTVSASGPPSQASGPCHAPLACGALGTYDRARVEAITASLGGSVAIVHEDERSILALDREPMSWEGSRERGLAWAESVPWRDGAQDWRGTSRRGGCGLVLEGRGRFLHSSVSGLGPLYRRQERGSVYFASRIDPLVQTDPKLLTIDWDAWAAILALRYPLGERTPFAEIKRLRPFSTLGLRLGRARRRWSTWPWAEIDVVADLDTAADGAAAGIEAALAPIDALDVCPLSGGRDSRMLLGAAVKRGLAPTALTASDDEGGRFEQDLAAPVAAALGVHHELLEPGADSYPDEWEQRAKDVEYQFVDHAWLVPLARRIEGLGSPVPDGYAIDTLLHAGTHFYTAQTNDRRHPRRASAALFERLRHYGDAPTALAEPLRGPLLARARDQFLAEARNLEGHPWQSVLTLYSTRTVRGISTYPSGLLGARARVLTPGASDPVVSAALSAEPDRQDRERLHAAILKRLAGRVAGLPSTTETPREASYLPRRWCSAPAVAMHRRHLADGPLAEQIAPELSAWLEAPGETLSPDLRLGMEAVSLFHSWWNRYRDRLCDVDAGDLLG